MPTKIEWTEVPGYPGYAASIDGHIRGPSGRTLSPMKNGSGHWYILCQRARGRKTRKLFVHRAVLLAFKGEPAEGLECCHNDGNPDNNHLDNLRWDTRMNNVLDRINHGTMPIPHESQSTKLKPANIREIFRLHRDGESSRKIGDIFGTSHTTIQKIIRGERWKGYGR